MLTSRFTIISSLPVGLGQILCFNLQSILFNEASWRYVMGKIVVFIVLCVISFHSAAGNDLFGQPQRLCSALASEELRAKGGWKPKRQYLVNGRA